MEETKHRKWLPNPGALSAIDEHNALYDAWEAATAEVERLRAELAERREADWILAADAERLMQEPAPVADAQTIEELAKIGDDAWRKARGLRREFSDLDHDYRQCLMKEVTAILRAARPYIQCSPEQLHTRISADSRPALLSWLNSRIRYRVEVPDDESDIATAAYMLGKHDGKTALDANKPNDEELAQILDDAYTLNYGGSLPCLDMSEWKESHKAARLAQARAARLALAATQPDCPTCARARKALEGEG